MGVRRKLLPVQQSESLAPTGPPACSYDPFKLTWCIELRGLSGPWTFVSAPDGPRRYPGVQRSRTLTGSNPDPSLAQAQTFPGRSLRTMNIVPPSGKTAMVQVGPQRVRHFRFTELLQDFQFGGAPDLDEAVKRLEPHSRGGITRAGDT